MAPKVFSKSDGFEPLDLLSFGRGHLRGAEVLFGSSHHCFDSAGYLAHLAIELLLKAMTLDARGSFVEGHDLFKVLSQARDAGASVTITPQQEGVFYLLNRFQEGRYPTPQNPVQIGNADLIPIQELWDCLLEQVPTQLRESFLKRDPLEKGGRVLMVKPREGGDAVF